FVVASGKRFPSDTGAFADWVASSATGRGDDLCLGFNAGSGGGGGGVGGGGGGGSAQGAGGAQWAAAARAQQQQSQPPVPLNYGLADIGMIGLRDVLVVAPAASFHPQHHHHHNDATAALLSSADHPIIPLLTTAPCLPDEPDRGRVPAGINLWQSQPPQQTAAWAQQSLYPSAGAPSSSYLCKPLPVPVLDSASATTAAGGVLGGCNPGAKGPGMGALMAVGVVGDGMSSSFMTCQDCGNKAKKDCVHRRCRTCCKSRGFDCSTHLKSTWVPAAQRRERQVSSAAAQPGGGAGQGSSASTSAAKKPRLSNDQTATTNTTSTSNTTTPPRSFDTSSSHQDAGFRQSLPGQVRAPAVFKCVRVTTMDDGEDEYAYQAMVRIGGHIFKGFLYDQGVAGEADAATNASSLDRSLSGDLNNDRGGGNNNAGNNRTSGGMIPNISELHLGGAMGGSGGASDAYAAGLGDGLMGGTAYGNPIN
ncbi:hypothetical protein Taro_010323, partial [Colocasia esculenta]|nr:hypothetical protein [Colocasia esculenta]